MIFSKHLNILLQMIVTLPFSSVVCHYSHCMMPLTLQCTISASHPCPSWPTVYWNSTSTLTLWPQIPDYICKLNICKLNAPPKTFKIVDFILSTGRKDTELPSWFDYMVLFWTFSYLNQTIQLENDVFPRYWYMSCSWMGMNYLVQNQ